MNQNQTGALDPEAKASVDFVTMLIGQASPVAKFGGLAVGVLVGFLVARSTGKKKR